MKTKVEIEDGKVVIVLVPENGFEKKITEGMCGDVLGDREVKVERKSSWEYYDVIRITMLEKILPPRVGDDFFGGNKFVPHPMYSESNSPKVGDVLRPDLNIYGETKPLGE